MFPATITLHNAQQLNAVLGALKALVPLTAADFASPAVGQAYEEAAGRVAAQAVEPTTAELVAQAQTRAEQARAKPVPEMAKPEATPAKPITYTEVSAAITAAVKTDRAAVLATLAAFGASKGPQLTPEQYAPFLAALDKALSEVQPA